MRNHRKSTDSAADRLGPLAALMRAAEPLDELSAMERERIKLRLRGEMAGRRPVARMRLLTVMVGVGLLLAGGAAVAGRLGLIRWPGAVRTPVGQEKRDPVPHRQVRGFPRATVPAPASAAAEVTAPAAPAKPVTTAEQGAPKPGENKTPALAVAHPARPRRPVIATDQPRGVNADGPSHELAPAPLAPAAPSPPVVSAVPVVPRTSPALAMVEPAEAAHRMPKALPASATSAAPNAQDLLGQAMRSLRGQHDPTTALDILARHAALFPQSPLASERIQLEVEALLALGRYPEALLRLDGMALDRIPHGGERYVVRGELRARAQRWNEAAADFDQALARVREGTGLHERALWGRATARAHLGDGSGSRTDTRLYLQSYPHGRFAAEAARLSTDQP
jgi:hypothetical protein